MPFEQLFLRSHNWAELKVQIDRLPSTKQKGDCFEHLVRHFLTLEPKYATRLSNVWLLADLPENVRERLVLPGPDEGIDLVGRTSDDKFWAIQAKYRSGSDGSLTRRELATFTDLAFGICESFDYALVCTPLDKFSNKLKLHGDKIGYCAGSVWRNLTPEFFSLLHAHLRHQVARATPYAPLLHQQRAIRNALKHYKNNNQSRGKLIMPCGTGKSLTAFWIAQALGVQKVLVAVPSLALIKQTLEVWARECFAHKLEVHWIAVCSDPSIQDSTRDDLAVLTHDLGVDVHTRVERVTKWLGDVRGDNKVVFTTYQSGAAVAEAARRAEFEFDLIILDEAHRTVGKDSKLFSHLLYDENIKTSKRLAMTATERRYSGKSERIASMESVQLYGKTFELLTFSDALAAHPPILSDYKIVTVLVSNAEVSRLVRSNAFVKPSAGKWDTEIEAQMFVAMIALRRAMRDFPISHAVSFHSSVAKARAFAENQERLSEIVPEFGDISVYHVNGKTKASVRDRQLKAFEASKRALVTNARCLTEGVDVPDINGVLFADPKRSVVDIVQAAGRALRPKNDGSKAFIVVPVEIEELADQAEVEGSAFAAVLTVLRALATNDDRIIEYFRSISEGRPWSGAIPFEVRIPDGVPIDADAFVRSIELSCWSKLASLSWRPFEEARSFAHSLRLASTMDWHHYCGGYRDDLPMKPADIPASPSVVYASKGWRGWGDWLSTGFRRTGEKRRFRDARAFAQSLKLSSQRQWVEFARGDRPDLPPKPDDVPSNPYEAYKDEGWVNFSDFLGYVQPRTKRKWRSFQEARRFTRALGLQSREEWKNFTKNRFLGASELPDDIPIKPDHVYANKGWKSWKDWLNSSVSVEFRPRASARRVDWPSFETARAYVRSIGLANGQQYYAFVRGKLADRDAPQLRLPNDPDKIYASEGWVNWPDWLGTERNWRSFVDAREFAHSLELRSAQEWLYYCKGYLAHLPKRPSDIPARPEKVYKADGWKGFRDWLGPRK